MLMTLMLVLTSCISQPKNESKGIQLKTEFPDPIDENGNYIVILDNDGNVKMPLWYWLKITEFAIDVQTNIELSRIE